jgi:peptidyl-prolyl cis-trans isomerase B (cyclophilin B)
LFFNRDFVLEPWHMNPGMSFLLRLSTVLCVGALVSALAQPLPPTPAPPRSGDSPKPGTEVAVIKTTEGDMVIEFWPEVAPNTVANFKKLAAKGFYDGTAFHRIIRGFMIQGGDPLTKDATKEAQWGTGGPGYQVKAEFNDRPHVRGVISMARSSDPNSAGSQFFICHGAAKSLDRQYTAFGRLIRGDEVLEKIASTPVTRSRSGENSKPIQRMGVISITIVPADSIQ